MATANYDLTSDETACLDGVLAFSPYSATAARVTAATNAVSGLAGAALERAQARLDKLTDHQTSLIQTAYSDTLVQRSPAVVLPVGAAIERQSVGGQDTLVVTSP